MITHVLVLLLSLTAVYATSPPITRTPRPPEPSSCPHDESVYGLDMDKMLGKWHVVSISTAIPSGDRGLVKPISGQTLTISNDSGDYRLIHSVGKRHQFVHEYKIVQEDRKINTYVPDQVNELKFAVLATDYDNVALVITCEKGYNFNRVARVLVRKGSDETQKYVDQMFKYLPQHGFQKDSMDKVEI